MAALCAAGLCIARAGVGLGEAVAPSAATDLVARTVPPSERSRAGGGLGRGSRGKGRGDRKRGGENEGTGGQMWPGWSGGEGEGQG